MKTKQFISGQIKASKQRQQQLAERLAQIEKQLVSLNQQLEVAPDEVEQAHHLVHAEGATAICPTWQFIKGQVEVIEASRNDLAERLEQVENKLQSLNVELESAPDEEDVSPQIVLAEGGTPLCGKCGVNCVCHA